ncbi:MAG: hypothetical protein A3J76_01805 [Candidatus Moranbacteria bacterium RBG_13_45_13]|nr:MAG: hypothetical protein A3J76_01805 [Candidatus Moranbacteria bacterium RBG_13_45_13]
MTDDPVKTKLEELSVPAEMIEKIKTELGATTVEQLAGLTEKDLVACGMKPLPARDLLKALAPPAPSAAEAAGAMSAVSFDAVLPAVPSDASWLEALRAGGVLKVDQSTVISAIRAALAHRAGLFTIPDSLVGLMEKFADENEEQVDPEFFKLRKQMTRRSYAEIFEAIEGLDGNYVTEARKKQLFQRIDQYLWPSIIEFYSQLKSWQEAWMQGAANPMIMMSAIVAASGGVGTMPPGMMQPPDTGVLRDHADAVADAVNKVFAGTGVQISAALAYDASKIKETLANPRLPALIGAANRDQMLRQMGVAVSATYPRLETNLTRFVLAIMQVKDQPAGNEELQYFSALFMLGSQIPWDQLGGGRSNSKRPTGIGRGEL